MLTAFPISDDCGRSTGMDLRDYFAAKLAQGDLMSRFSPSSYDEDISMYCEFYYRCADLMVKARDADV